MIKYNLNLTVRVNYSRCNQDTLDLIAPILKNYNLNQTFTETTFQVKFCSLDKMENTLGKLDKKLKTVKGYNGMDVF